MLEDLRNHDPNPNAEERAWMRTNPFAVVVRLVVLAGIAVAIGVNVSQPNLPERPTAVAATTP